MSASDILWCFVSRVYIFISDGAERTKEWCACGMDKKFCVSRWRRRGCCEDAGRRHYQARGVSVTTLC